MKQKNVVFSTWKGRFVIVKWVKREKKQRGVVFLDKVLMATLFKRKRLRERTGKKDDDDEIYNSTNFLCYIYVTLHVSFLLKKNEKYNH